MKKFFKNAGFTLFELLAVLAIMAIIAGIAVPRVMQTIKNARIEALKSNMQLIANSMQRFATEKELTSCIGGMFVINPNVDEVAADGDDDGIIYYEGTAASLDDDTDDQDLNNVTIDPEESNGTPSTGSKAEEIQSDYIEGGIPAHIRVIVYTDAEGQGHIVVSYGDVDDGSGDGEELYLNGITPVDMGMADNDTPYIIAKTFELESGEGHNHLTPQS